MTMKTFMRTIMTLAVLLISLENSFAAWPGEAWPGEAWPNEAWPDDAWPEKTTTTVSGSVNGHEYVDLGLSVKWATCNVGAELPSDNGNHYFWGETAPQAKEWKKCQTVGMELDDIGGTSRDIARVKWGKPWRMPTEGEIRELLDLCKWCWTKVNGHKGYIVTGPNGNSIFLPSVVYESWQDCEEDGGSIWSSTPYKNEENNSAYELCFIRPLCASVPYVYSFDDLKGLGFESTYFGPSLSVSYRRRDIALCVRPVVDL